MLRLGADRFQRALGRLRLSSLAPWADPMILAVAVAAASAMVFVGASLQGDLERTRMPETQALLDSIDQPSARCKAARSERDRKAQLQKFSEHPRRKS